MLGGLFQSFVWYTVFFWGGGGFGDVVGAYLSEVFRHDALQHLNTIGHVGIVALDFVEPSMDALCTLFPEVHFR